MKCDYCDGCGYIDGSDGLTEIKCWKCEGTGQMEENNEDWFCRLPTEEKANVLAQFEMLIKLKGNHSCIGCIYDCKIKCMPDIVNEWKAWLKQPHVS